MTAQLFLIDGLEPDFVEAETTSGQYVFQARLLSAMEMKGVTDADVVRAVNMPASTWHQWITGQIEYPLAGEHFKAVCRYLGVTSDFLLGLTDRPNL